MIPLVLYLVFLTVAPQLWVPLLLGWRTDYICIVLMFGSLLMSGQGHKFFSFSLFDGLLAAFAAWVTLSAIANGWTPESPGRVIFYWKMLLIVKLFKCLLYDVERVRRMTNWLTLLAVVLAIQAIQQKLSNDGMGWANQGLGWIDPLAHAEGEKGRSRWIGIFAGEGVYAVLFTATIPFALAYLSKEYGIGKRMLAAIAVSLLLWGTYCTGARGGLIATLFVVSLYLMIRSRISIKSVLMAAALSGAVYSLAPAYLTTVDDVSKSSLHRVEMWAEGLDMVKENPVFGVGPGNFRNWSGRLVGHNSAVEIQGELGPLGLMLWISMIYVCIKGVFAFRSAAQNEQDKGFGAALLLSVTGYLASAMFVTLEYETFYLLLAFCAALGEYPPAAVRLVRRDFINIIGGAAVWLMGLQAFVIMYLG